VIGLAKALLNIPALSQSLALLWRGKNYLLKEGRLYLWSLSMSMNRDKDYARALRYRRLALAESDKEKANLLKLARDR
jgi:hypothetical protein